MIMVVALVTMMSAGLEANRSKNFFCSAVWTNTTVKTVTRTVSPSQFLDCSGNKYLSIVSGSLK